MSLTLYRKHRPQSFEELIGQDHIKKILQNEIKTEKVAHAYLFSGPRGVGKTTMARLLAKAVSCKNAKDGEPCNKCDICSEISGGRSLDLIEIDAASNRGINEIRELREQVRFSPSKNEYKVFIIDEVHMLTTEAFNALLKTLEEPPKHAIFILATTEIHKVPDTIISRCQRFNFAKIKSKELVGRLEKIAKAEGINVDKEVLENIAWHSEGCLRDAESLLGQILSLGEKKITVAEAELVIPRSNFDSVAKMFGFLAAKDAGGAISLINQMTQEGADLKYFSSDLIEFLRQVLLAKISGSRKESDLGSDILSLGEKMEEGELAETIRIFISHLKDREYPEIPQLPLELAIMQICFSSPDGLRNQKSSSGEDSYGHNKPRPSGRGGEISRPSEPAERKEGPESRPEKQPEKSASEEKEKLPKPKKAENKKADGLGLDDIRKGWDRILASIRKSNYSLSALIKMSAPLSLEGDVLKLGFPYEFHSDRIKDKKNKMIAEEALEEALGRKITIEARVVEQSIIDESRPKPEISAVSKKDGPVGSLSEGFLGQILEAFGGEVIE